MKRIMLTMAVAAALALAAGQAAAFSFGKTKYFHKQGQDTWVKITKGNKKLMPFDHPGEFTAEDISKALAAVQYFRPGFFSVTGKQGKEYQLFSDEEIGILAGHISDAFAEADGEQWVDFSIHNFRGQSFIGSFRQSDGVMFVKDGKLNIALRNIAVKVSMDDRLNTYDPTRGYRSSTKLNEVNGVELVDKNWVAIPVDSIASLDTDAPVEAPYFALPDTTKGGDSNTDKTNEAVDKTGDAAGETPATDKPAEPEAPEKSAKERLLELQELYDAGMISEKEYQEKRQEILEEI